VWTSAGHLADHIFLLARTDPDAPKHKGISFLLVDMRQPGVEVRPIKMMSGAAEFNEVYFTDAVCPKDDVVGGVNAGWAVAMTLLGFERGEAAATVPIRFQAELDRLIALARKGIGKLAVTAAMKQELNDVRVGVRKVISHHDGGAPTDGFEVRSAGDPRRFSEHHACEAMMNTSGQRVPGIIGPGVAGSCHAGLQAFHGRFAGLGNHALDDWADAGVVNAALPRHEPDDGVSELLGPARRSLGHRRIRYPAHAQNKRAAPILELNLTMIRLSRLARFEL
jgi:hypothetical protein